MDTFKIIVIIFLMILTYQIYQINCVVFKDKVEGFEGTTQSVYGIDDTNAINTLAQIAKNLLAGGVTVPGNMRVNGDISTGEGKVSINNGTINLTSDGGGGLYFLKSGGVSGDKVWNKLYTGDLTVQGGINVSGRNILAELDKCVRKDKQYYLDIGARANGDACCGANSKGLIIHGDANLTAAGWGTDATTRFTFRQA